MTDEEITKALLTVDENEDLSKDMVEQVKNVWLSYPLSLSLSLSLS